ncbi:MAG: PmoA family protein, partial [Bryobacteraceae bacterium]
GDVNGWDFWANEQSQKGVGKGKGKVVLKKVIGVKSGQKEGSIEASFDWVDGTGKAILDERRTMVFHSDPNLRIVDFDIVLTALDTVKFGDTKEGTFALRLAPSLEEPSRGAPESPARTGKMVNAEGLEGERQVWGKRSAWVDYFGEVEGEKLGIAIFDHPGNPRHPTFWHARSYGLFAANIFGERDFMADKTRDGSMTLKPGEKLRFRYRVVIHPGDHRSAGIADLYRQYAQGK